MNTKIFWITCILLTLPGYSQEWTARYNGTGDSLDGANAIAVDDAGNVYVTGRSFGIGSGEDYVTVKYNAAGTQQWAPRYNGPVGSYDNAFAIAIDDSVNVYVTGRSYGVGTYYDYATIKYTPSGMQQWVGRYDGPGNGIDIANAVAIDNTGNIYVTGESFGAGTDLDYATLKYLYTVHIEEQAGFSLKAKNFAGPSIVNGPLKLPSHSNCKLYNITGREIKPYFLPPGIYFLQIDGNISTKIIKIK